MVHKDPNVRPTAREALNAVQSIIDDLPEKIVTSARIPATEKCPIEPGMILLP